MSTLESLLQEGVLVNRMWLKEHGFDRSTIDYYLRSGKIKTVARGVYRKPGPPLKWQNVVYSLQLLGIPIHVGHLSALQYHGFQHFIPLGGSGEVFVYGDDLPSWIGSFKSCLIRKLNRPPFPAEYREGLIAVPFGTWDWPIMYSTPEQAFLELASTISKKEEIFQAMMMLEGAANLRPGHLQELLQNCRQIKAKRLFLWMAKTAGHSWYEQIDINALELGTGKRQIVPDGVFVREFKITVPKEVSDGQTESLF